MKALITGVTGFAGSHLADYLIDQQGVEVHGIRRPRSRTDFIRYDVHYHDGDITDYTSLADILTLVKPDYIFHLAAQSFVPLSWQAPRPTIEVNFIGTLNILEATRRTCPSATVHIACTSEEYGLVDPDECPITEEQPLRPLSPYGVSKVACDLLAQQYHRSYATAVVITRAFNHTGPRRGEQYVTSKIARQLALISLGKAEPILKLGNLDAVRDFTDVRDTVRAYWLAASLGKRGCPYNIGTGIGRTIYEVVSQLTSIDRDSVPVVQDPQLMRPSDVPRLIADASALHFATGWKPEIPFEQTMIDLFDYWVMRIK